LAWISMQGTIRDSDNVLCKCYIASSVIRQPREKKKAPQLGEASDHETTHDYNVW